MKQRTKEAIGWFVLWVAYLSISVSLFFYGRAA